MSYTFEVFSTFQCTFSLGGEGGISHSTAYASHEPSFTADECTFSGSLLVVEPVQVQGLQLTCVCPKVGEGELCPQCAAGQTGTNSDGLRARERPYTCVTLGQEPVYLPETVKDTQGISPYSTVPEVHSPFS